MAILTQGGSGLGVQRLVLQFVERKKPDYADCHRKDSRSLRKNLVVGNLTDHLSKIALPSLAAKSDHQICIEHLVIVLVSELPFSLLALEPSSQLLLERHRMAERTGPSADRIGKGEE